MKSQFVSQTRRIAKTLTLTMSLALSLNLSLSFLAAPQAMAAENPALRLEIESLIRADLAAHHEAIQTKATGLSAFEREALYTELHKDFLGASLINLLPAFGTGSFLQGDVWGGVGLAAIDAIGVGLLASSFLPGMRDNGGWGGAMMLGYGILALGVGRIAGFTVPIVHSNLYNDSLRQALAAPSQQSQFLRGPRMSYGFSF